MNKTIREKLDSWDLKSLLLTIILFSIGILLVYYFTDIRDRFRQGDEEKFKGQTKGQVISIEPIERMTQGKWKGTQIFIDSYKVLYNYTINGHAFEKTDIIPVSAKNQKFIKKILDRGTNDTFTVRFDLTNPEKSLLVESN
jgi:hypothetical protein